MKLPPVALAFAALFCTLDTLRVSAQGDQPYLALLDTYAGGETTRAAEALSAWPEARVRAAVRTLDARTALDRARTAIMLHTDAAFAEPPDGREPFHVGVARSFLGRLLDAEPSRSGGVRDFAARWHALIGILYCVREDVGRAQLEINRGLTIDSNHKDVNLVAGALIEHWLHRQVSNLRGRHPDLKGLPLAQATVKYRSIVSEHPDFPEARLRLGWTFHLNDSHESSRKQLEEVLARAARPTCCTSRTCSLAPSTSGPTA